MVHEEIFLCFIAHKKLFCAVYSIKVIPMKLMSFIMNFYFCLFQHVDGTQSSWDAVREVYDIEKNKVIKKAPQLTLEHINPNPTRRMKVKLAAQVLSHRTASAIRSYCDDLPQSCKRTADTIELFNNLFDFLNSSNIQEVGTRRPALLQLWSAQKQVSVLQFITK